MANDWKALKACGKCGAKTFRPVRMTVAAFMRSSIGCRQCGERWQVQLSRGWIVVNLLWLVIICPLGFYTAIFTFRVWPLVLAWGGLALLFFHASQRATLRKQFDLDR